MNRRLRDWLHRLDEWAMRQLLGPDPLSAPASSSPPGDGAGVGWVW